MNKTSFYHARILCIFDSMADPNDIVNMYNMNNDTVPTNQQTAENRPENTLDSE